MTRDAVRKALIEALAAVAPEIDFAAADPAAPIREEVGIDSLDSRNVVAASSGRLGVAIPETDQGRLASIDAATAYLAGGLSV